MSNNNLKLFMGKNKFFYFNLLFTLFFTISSYFINKFIASTQYIPLGIAIFTIITVFITKLKDYIDENDTSSTLGKTRKDLVDKENEVKHLKELIEDKQAKINSLILTIQESQSLKKLKESMVKWYVNTDNDCYYRHKAENNLKELTEKATEEINKYIQDGVDL
ncbi:hypothetical protein [Acinetobacter sp. AM]|uniref:hypothetical protein n=1 Tax=Acinetobacter sp. AM TaxID=2170730 RepID=UPI001058389F|nr:hypothetical protein [Acinetobacter sp. AM]